MLPFVLIRDEGIAVMIKTILVPATGNETDAAGYAAALAVARAYGAHIDALHVRLDPVEMAVSMSTEGAGGTLLAGIIDSLERDAGEGEAKARAGFAAFCSREGLSLVAAPSADDAKPSAQFHVETGGQARWMTVYGLTADLAVAARGAPRADAEARSTLEALLLETGRPLLIPGAVALSADFAERVVIAWKPTPQAARAVAFAMPFLIRAKEITVLTVDEEGNERGAAARLIAHLAWHGIKAVPERLAPGAEGAAATMLAAASAKGGLLVMGGYGHTRLREWVFGGFTSLVLDTAEVPVLMAH
jgi:nucleotide-binding universal stress UspA family protein